MVVQIAAEHIGCADHCGWLQSTWVCGWLRIAAEHMVVQIVAEHMGCADGCRAHGLCGSLQSTWLCGWLRIAAEHMVVLRVPRPHEGCQTRLA
jgi:hypothetical protein